MWSVLFTEGTTYNLHCSFLKVLEERRFSWMNRSMVCFNWKLMVSLMVVESLSSCVGVTVVACTPKKPINEATE